MEGAEDDLNLEDEEEEKPPVNWEELIGQDWEAFKWAPEEYRNDLEKMRHAISLHGSTLQFIGSDLREEISVKPEDEDYDAEKEEIFKAFILTAAANSNAEALAYAPTHLLKDKDFMLKACCQNVESLKFLVDANSRNDRDFMRTVLQEVGPGALAYAGEDVKADKDIVLSAVSKMGLALKLVHQDLQEDPDVARAAVGQNWKALDYVTCPIDREIARRAINNCWHAYTRIPEELRGDINLAHDAVAGSWAALAYASEELRGNKELVMAAVKQNWEALKLAATELRGDAELAEIAIGQDALALKALSPELQSDRELVMKAVKKNWRALAHASQELRDDEEVVVVALAQSSQALAFASERLRADFEIIKKAAGAQWLSLAHAVQPLFPERKLDGCSAEYWKLISAALPAKGSKERRKLRPPKCVEEGRRGL